MTFAPPTPSHAASVAAPAPRWLAWLIIMLILIGSGLLLFVRLGHYSLWDDEAITAMTARSVLHTLDTDVHVDSHNLLIYRNGLLTRDLKDRFTPPLQFYVLAPVMGLLGDGNTACRLPFAVCGFLTVLILLRWLWHVRPAGLVWWAALVILLTNASFFLFFRQCRYYGLAMLLSTAVAYLYFRLQGETRQSRLPHSRRVVLMAAALALLLASQYLNYAAVVGCLVVDYLLWGRRRNLFSRSDWLVLLLPQLLVGAVVCAIWNPLARQGVDSYTSTNWMLARLKIFYWNWRDMLASDFVILPLLLICPLLFYRCKNHWLLRAPVALVVYLLVISLAVATDLEKASCAEIRYLAPVLPLCVGIGILGVWGSLAMKPLARVVILIISGLSLFADAPPQGLPVLFSSTGLQFMHELVVPQQESYAPVIAWVQQNIPPGKSVYVEPAFKTYPLMLRAPAPVYAWQLTDPPRADFAQLPAIHFWGRIAPDYLIEFGHTDQSAKLQQAIKELSLRHIHYRPVAILHYAWKDTYRPERIWRSFVTVPPQPGEEITIYQKD